LPKSWTEDAQRREECHIPDAVEFRTKEELALAMIDRAVEVEIPGKLLLADSAYGRSHRLRDRLRSLGFDYALGIQSNQKMWRLDVPQDVYEALHAAPSKGRYFHAAMDDACEHARVSFGRRRTKR
jgi:SRSO17 transposase